MTFSIDELSHMSDPEVLASLRTMVGNERQLRARTIAYLVVVEARGIHLDLSCSSMFDFCLRHLKMSESEAYRRIVAARLAKRFPALVDMLATGQLHLSALLVLAPYLTEENFAELTSAASGRTRRQIEQILIERFPRPDVPQRIVEALAPGRFKLQMTVSAELMAKIQQAIDLMRHTNPKGDLPVLFERAIDALLRRLTKVKTRHSSRGKKAQSGRLSADTRRAVFERDAGQCTFTSPDGERCPSKAFLEIDHLIPRALGGSDELSNLALVCGQHNRHRATKIFGRALIARMMSRHRRRRRSAYSSHPTSSTPPTSPPPPPVPPPAAPTAPPPAGRPKVSESGPL